MKYLGILLVLALVLVGSVAMAGWEQVPDIGNEEWELWVDGGYNNNSNPHLNSYSVNFEFKVTVEPYLELNIDNTKFWWKFHEAWGLNDSDVYYPSDQGVQVAQISFITNWPAIAIGWSGIGWDNSPPSSDYYDLIPQWTLKSGDWELGTWYDHRTVGDGDYTWPVQHQYQPPSPKAPPTGDHYEIFNRIKIPQGKKPAPGTYTDIFTLTFSMAEL